MTQTSLQLYLRLLRYLRPYLPKFFLALIAMAGVAIMEPLLPALLKPLIDQGFLGASSQANVLAPEWIPFFIVLVFAIKALFEYGGNVLSQLVANSAVRDIRAELFAAQLSRPMNLGRPDDAGDFISRISYDASQVSAAITSAFLVIMKDTLIIVGLTAYLVYLSWKLTLIVILVIPVIAIFIYTAGRQLRVSNRVLQNLMARMTAYLRGAYGGLRDIKLYQLEAKSSRDFSVLASRVVDETMRSVRVQALNLPLVQVFAAIGVSVVIWFALMFRGEQSITPGFFVSYVAALAMIFEPIRRISATNLTIQKGLAAAESIFSVLDGPHEPPLSVIKVNEMLDNGLPKGPILKVDGCDAQWISSDGAPGFELSSISFSVGPGQAIAIVGSSGSGKSTLLSLILGFVAAKHGSIHWADQDVTNNPVFLRSLFAVVGQHPYLFTGTVRENLAAGSIKSDADIWHCLSIVGLDEFIHLLGGLDSMLLDDASLLSGGQRQRLAIARALLRSAPLIVLDEATNAIEEQLECQILQRIKGEFPSRGLILVTHRLKSIDMASEVLLLKSGRLVVKGSPSEVRTTKPYAELQASP